MQKRPQVGVGILITQNGKLLMGKRIGAHGKGSYGTCGGHLEYGETPEECIRREVLEETGLRVKSLKFLCVSNILDYDKHYVDITFLGEVYKGEPKVLEPNKVERWEWYSFDRLPTPIFKAVKLAIKSYKAGRHYNSKT